MGVIFSVLPAAMVTTKHGFDHFYDLLTAVGNVDGIRRVQFPKSSPQRHAPRSVCSHGSKPGGLRAPPLPAAVRSDRVLALMHRGYTADRYLERLADTRRHIPDLAVSTDIIVSSGNKPTLNRRSR